MIPIEDPATFETIVLLNSIVPEPAAGGYQVGLDIVQELDHEDKYNDPHCYKGRLFRG